MRMNFIDGDGRVYQRYFMSPKIEVIKFLDTDSKEPNDWMTIKVRGEKGYALHLELEPEEVKSLLWSLVFDDVKDDE